MLAKLFEDYGISENVDLIISLSLIESSDSWLNSLNPQSCYMECQSEESIGQLTHRSGGGTGATAVKRLCDAAMANWQPIWQCLGL